MKPTPIIVLGANGNCVDIAETIQSLMQQGHPVRFEGFLDDNEALHGRSVAGYPVLGSIVLASKYEGAKFVCGIGSPRSYRRKSAIIASTGLSADRWATIVHPQASVSPSARIGAGTVLLSGAAIGARATIGNHVMVLQNSVISHDSRIGDYTAIATGVCVSGMVEVGVNCYLGSNCSIREGLRVGDRALIGMGAVVTRSVSPDAVVVGNPARPR